MGGPGDVKEKFDGADQNDDGQLTKKEFVDAGLGDGKTFDDADKDKDGKLSLDEMHSLHNAFQHYGKLMDGKFRLGRRRPYLFMPLWHIHRYILFS